MHKYANSASDDTPTDQSTDRLRDIGQEVHHNICIIKTDITDGK